jgi:hypothetical protein
MYRSRLILNIQVSTSVKINIQATTKREKVQEFADYTRETN